MNRKELVQAIKTKRSFLCIGLDTDIDKIPKHLLDDEDPIFSFNKAIIEATEDLCVAYKPNTAFYERYGTKGWSSLQRTYEILPKNTLSIADAKRGDIGNTSSMYAQAFFDKKNSGMGFDAITVAPYMGKDSLVPFLQFADKWTIVLGLTSNEGSKDFQILEDSKGKMFFQEVLDKVQTWGTEDNLMFVIGATQGDSFVKVRESIPNHFLLVPGVGAQGGSLEEVCRYGMNAECGLLVNSTRQIIYASSGKDFAEKARESAELLQQSMELELQKANIF